MKPLKILVVEDDPITAEDIKMSLMDLGHFVIGPAYSLNQAKSLINDQLPDLALLDIQLDKHMEGIDIASWIKEHYPIPVVFLTAFSDQITLDHAKDVHPEHYLIKPFNATQLRATIEIVISNFYAPDHHTHIFYRLRTMSDGLNIDLTDREVDVIKQLVEGLSNKAIADSMFISEHTVKSHLKSIFNKIGVKSRSELIARLIT